MGGGERKSGPDRKRREMKGAGVEGLHGKSKREEIKGNQERKKFIFTSFDA